MQKGRIPGWLILPLAGAGLLIVGIPSLWVFSSLTAKPLHPNLESVPTVADFAPPPEFAGAAEQARQLALAHLVEENLPGLSVAVGVNGNIVWAQGFGYADLWTGTPVRPDHRFRIGTASTVLTSAAAGLLAQEGRLSLDEDIKTYVPAFAKEQQPLTVRELMGHTRGVTPDDGDEAPLLRQHCESPVEAVEHFENWLYSDPEDGDSIWDWLLVSAAVESAGGEPFLAFMDEYVFAPLGMQDTIADPGPDPVLVEGEDFPLFIRIRELVHDPETTLPAPDDSNRKLSHPDRVVSYYPRFASDPNYGMHLTRLFDYSCYSGSAEFLSTPSDLVRFGMGVSNGTLLEPSTLQLLQTQQRSASGVDTGHGLGWDIKTVTLAGKPTRAFGHDGNVLDGMVASLLTFPDYGIVVAVTSNISYADTSSLAAKIAKPFAERAGSR